MNEKFKNYGLWVSLFALFGLFLSDMSWMPHNYDMYVSIILSILVGLGIVSSPEKGKWYGDKHDQLSQENEEPKDISEKDKK